MTSIGIYCSQMNDDIEHCISKILESFARLHITFYLYEPMYRELKRPEIKDRLHAFSVITDIRDTKFVISIGGDGSFLRASHLVSTTRIPIVGINLGRMGFLTDISEDEIEMFSKNIEYQSYYFEERPFIEVIFRSLQANTASYLALNEVCIGKKESIHLMTVHTWIDEEYLGSFWSDGMLVASPTGSTAYSLSLGGPIMSPNSKNFIINAIAPHSLTVRPIIVPDSSIIKLKIEGRDNVFNVSVDSTSHSFSPDQSITIKKSNNTLRILKVEGKNYFTTLKNKLMWGVDIRN